MIPSLLSTTHPTTSHQIVNFESTSNPQPSEVSADLELEEDDEIHNDREDTQETDHETSDTADQQVTIRKRRELLDAKLKNYKRRESSLRTGGIGNQETASGAG